MVKQIGKNIFSIFLGIVALQIILPFIILCATSLIKVNQQHYVAENTTRKEIFKNIVVKADDPGLIFHGANELTLNGKWYDVKAISKENNTYTISVLADDNETKLSEVSKVSATGNHSLSQISKKMIPFFFLYFEDPIQWHTLINNFKISHSTMYYVSALDQYKKIITPPPLPCSLS